MYGRQDDHTRRFTRYGTKGGHERGPLHGAVGAIAGRPESWIAGVRMSAGELMVSLGKR